MHTQIVQVGNSLGVRLPKAVLDGMDLKRSSRLQVEQNGDAIVLRPTRSAREGWAAALSQANTDATEDLWGDVPVAEVWEDHA
jgi:antitoxin component of MazEF toxin-antitoxin module